MNYKLIYKDKTYGIEHPLQEHEIQSQITEIFEKQHYKPTKTGKVAIDLGANVGLASIYLADKFDTVYAIEANPEIYKYLVKNTKGLKNVKTFNCAIVIVNKDRVAMFGKNAYLAQSLYKEYELQEPTAITRGVTLNRFFEENKIDHVDLLKIDIEGAEYDVFFDQTFGEVAQKIDTIIGESHVDVGNANRNPLLIPPILKLYGYKTEMFGDGNYFVTVSFENTDTGYRRTVDLYIDTMFRSQR